MLQGKYLECVLLTRQNRNKTFFLHVTLSSETVPRMYFYLFNHTKRVVLLPNYTDQIIITIIFFFFWDYAHSTEFPMSTRPQNRFFKFFFFPYLFIHFFTQQRIPPSQHPTKVYSYFWDQKNREFFFKPQCSIRVVFSLKCNTNSVILSDHKPFPPKPHSKECSNDISSETTPQECSNFSSKTIHQECRVSYVTT